MEVDEKDEEKKKKEVLLLIFKKVNGGKIGCVFLYVFVGPLVDR